MTLSRPVVTCISGQTTSVASHALHASNFASMESRSWLMQIDRVLNKSFTNHSTSPYFTVFPQPPAQRCLPSNPSQDSQVSWPRSAQLVMAAMAAMAEPRAIKTVAKDGSGGHGTSVCEAFPGEIQRPASLWQPYNS